MELRKVASRDEAIRLLSEAAASGLERAVWARQNGINARSLNLWRVHLERQHSRPPAIRLVELVPAATTPKDSGVRLRCGAVVVEVDAHFDERTLARVLAAVSSC